MSSRESALLISTSEFWTVCAAAPCCDDSCMNRAIYWECTKDNCTVGECCQNRRFQRKQYAPLQPFKTDHKGWGLRAKGPIKSGGFVIEYVGEVVDVDACEARVRRYKEEDKCLYVHVLNERLVIDAGMKGNMARFMNHSCEPNCTTVRWVVANEDRIGVFALRPIETGEEITIDYSCKPSV